MENLKDSQDRLYKLLSRPSINEMIDLYRRQRQMATGVYCSLDNIQFVKKHGWEWEEFLNARYNYLNSNNTKKT